MISPVLLMVRELGIGGCERDLTKIAKALDRARFEPHVGCFRDEGIRADELREAGIPIVRFPVSSFRSPSFIRGIWMFRHYAQAHRIRLLHTLDAPTNAFGIAAARITGLRPAIASQLWFLDTIPRGMWGLHRLSLRFADAVIVNSQAVRKLLIEEKLPSERVYVSHNGIDTSVFHPAAGSAMDVDDHRGVVVGAVCALRPEKRLDLLLDAFARTKKQHPSIKLLIVGSGEMLAPLESQCERLGVRNDCRFEPAQKDVAPWMRRIDIFVMSSQSESFPNGLLEAMACGCCVIGSNVGGIPELIESGKSGLLFRPGDVADLSEKLARLITNAELRQTLAANAASRAANEFSMKQAISRIERIYTSSLECKSGLRAQEESTKADEVSGL